MIIGRSLDRYSESIFRAFALAPNPAIALMTVHPASPRSRKSFSNASHSGLPSNFPLAALSDSPINIRMSIQISLGDRSSASGSSFVNVSIIIVQVQQAQILRGTQAERAQQSIPCTQKLMPAVVVS